MFWANPNGNICMRVQKNHLPLCTCFVYLRAKHVSIPLLDMLHHCTYCYTLTTLKLKKKLNKKLKLKQKSRNQYCRKIFKSFCLERDSKIPYEINNCRNILKLDHTT